MKRHFCIISTFTQLSNSSEWHIDLIENNMDEDDLLMYSCIRKWGKFILMGGITNPVLTCRS